jgi:hypothetical protein
MLFNDERKFVIEISRLTVNSDLNWIVITRRNDSDYLVLRVENFYMKEDALKYYFEIIPQTPFVLE